MFDEGSAIKIRAFRPIPGSSSPLTVNDVDPGDGIDIRIFENGVRVYGLDGIAAGQMIIPLTQAGWASDSRGYNFEYAIAGGSFPTNGGALYRVEFTIHTLLYGPLSVDLVMRCNGRMSVP